MVDLIKIMVVFLVMVLLTFKKVSLWISLLASTFLLGLLFRLSLIRIVRDLFFSAIARETLFLLGAFVVILFFSNLLKETGRMVSILEGFRHFLKDIRVVIALLPAIIGLMPLAGGALVSAPMVVAGSDELRLSPEQRTFVNYWFRHLWEYVVPTFPALLMAAALIGIPVRRLGWINLPITAAAILSGIVVGFWGVSKPIRREENLSDNPSVWGLFKNLCPLLFALSLVIGFKVELVYAFGVVILGMIVFYRIGWPPILKGFKQSIPLELLFTVILVMGFKKILESSQAIPSVSAALSSSGIPNWLIAMSVPFLIGVITGVTYAPVGITLPILIPLLQNDPKFYDYMMLAFASGICGTLVSPLHLCLILTKDYFGAEWKGVYRLLWVPVGSILIVGLLITIFA